MSALRTRRPEPCDLLVVGHHCVLPVNQAPYSEPRERGWRLTLAVPGRWRHEFPRSAFRPAAPPGTEGSLLLLPVVVAGWGQCHTVQRRALAERGRTRVQEMFSEDASVEAIRETLTTVVHSSDRPMGGRDA